MRWHVCDVRRDRPAAVSFWCARAPGKGLYVSAHTSRGRSSALISLPAPANAQSEPCSSWSVRGALRFRPALELANSPGEETTSRSLSLTRVPRRLRLQERERPAQLTLRRPPAEIRKQAPPGQPIAPAIGRQPRCETSPESDPIDTLRGVGQRAAKPASSEVLESALEDNEYRGKSQ